MTRPNALESTLAHAAQAYLDTSTSGFLLLDSDGLVQFINPAACELLGCTADQAIGGDWLNLYVAEDRTARYRTLFDELLEADAHKQTVEEIDQLCALNGVVRHVRCRATSVKDASGEVSSLAVCIDDRTHLRNVKRELEKMRKMGLLGQLAGGVAHDFNNLLQIIYGNAQLMQYDPDGDADSLECILEAAERGTRLVHRMMSFAGRESGPSETVAVGELVSGTVEFLRGSLPKKIRIDSEIDVFDARVTADPSDVENAIMNLALNACDAMPDGGELSIECAQTVVNGSHTNRIPAASNGDYIRLSVTDTGHGIEPENLKQIFEPFFTTKDWRDGTGLGLATVHGFAERAGGFVDVRSKVGIGTTVEFYLPKGESLN